MELTVISGKGGTGKTTVAMALAQLNERMMMADCDVDAPNLYLYLKGQDVKKEYFYALKKAVIDERFCTKCGRCEQACAFGAIENARVNPFACEGCAACSLVCPEDAITMRDEKAADAYVTKTDDGYITRAQMEIGSDGSGKLVTMLRENIRKIADDDALIVIDGSPGIGCPVISSITASDMVLIVTEPTQSGYDDFIRVAELCAHFGVETLACVNKYDINEEISRRIEEKCLEQGIALIGRIPYDETVMHSVNALRPITEYADSAASNAVKEMWAQMLPRIREIQMKKKEEAEE